MGAINTYPDDTTTAADDKFLTLDNAGTTKLTAASVLSTYIHSPNSVGTTQIADASVPNAKLATGAGQPGGAWTSWTPTFSNLTVGNGTLNASKYTRIGNTVHVRLRLTLGTTSSVGTTPTFTLPVTSIDYIDNTSSIASTGLYRDVSAPTTFTGFVIWLSTTTASFAVNNAAGTYTSLQTFSSTVPFTWATTDIISVAFSYEAV